MLGGCSLLKERHALSAASDCIAAPMPIVHAAQNPDRFERFPMLRDFVFLKGWIYFQVNKS
jgi:hypothetical protein